MIHGATEPFSPFHQHACRPCEGCISKGKKNQTEMRNTAPLVSRPRAPWRHPHNLVLTCSHCLKMCALWWFRADFTIFQGVWFCCFSTSTDVRFCLTPFSIRMFALPENVRFMVMPCSFHFFQGTGRVFLRTSV